MERKDLVDGEVLLRHVLDEVDRERVRRRHRRRVRRRRRVGVGLDQELLLRQVHHQQVVGVQAARDVPDLDAPRPVRQHAAIAHAFHRGLLAGLREVIGAHGRRNREDPLEVRLRELVDDERDAFARERAHAARVIVVVMAHDEVLDRLR